MDKALFTVIDRYSLPAMATVWADETRLDHWLAVELAQMQAQETLGIVPTGTHARVSAAAAIDSARMLEIEAEVHHDVIAFLTAVGETIPEDGDRRWLHLGMTSSDLVDTALSLQIKQAGSLIQDVLSTLRQTIWQRAVEHKHTPCIGRSHGIHGEPISFGLKLLTWVDELDRAQARLSNALEEARVGQMSGAMGTYAGSPPDVEAKVCQSLGLKPAKTSTQVIGRDIHAQVVWALASVANSVERFSVELRHLQRTEVLEVEEAFAKGQKGSSAMPHKRNPISGENLTGIARLIRSSVVPAMENVVLWHERDISHSSVERVMFPDAFILTHYMLVRLNRVMANLQIFPDNMRRNMTLYGGVIFSQRVLLALVDAGMTREDAYKLVQTTAHAAWNTESGNFKGAMMADVQVGQVLSAEKLAECFDETAFLAHVDTIFARFEG